MQDSGAQELSAKQSLSVDLVHLHSQHSLPPFQIFQVERKKKYDAGVNVNHWKMHYYVSFCQNILDLTKRHQKKVFENKKLQIIKVIVGYGKAFSPLERSQS
mmetsp:Transcript_5135/g.7101  ORF Transcript_5135/g.7101 Transcript_5135/m.7101 type:complete len:102 (-) Transcript_5135:25-330(-)